MLWWKSGVKYKGGQPITPSASLAGVWGPKKKNKTGWHPGLGKIHETKCYKGGSLRISFKNGNKVSVYISALLYFVLQAELGHFAWTI